MYTSQTVLLRVFDAGAYATYQALRPFETKGKSGTSHTVFSNSVPVIGRAPEYRVGLGQAFARSITEIAERVGTRVNTVTLQWTPSHMYKRAEGNEVEDGFAKEAAEIGRAHV